jgi:hypothetical protein
MVQRRKAFAVFVGERPVKPGRRDSLREAQRKISRRIVTLLGQA